PLAAAAGRSSASTPRRSRGRGPARPARRALPRRPWRVSDAAADPRGARTGRPAGRSTCASVVDRPPEEDAMVQSMFPILITRDLGRALGFHRELLGGIVTCQLPPS